MKMKKIAGAIGILIVGLAIGWWIGANLSIVARHFPGLTAFGSALAGNRNLRGIVGALEDRERAYSLGFQATQRENQELTDSNRFLRETNRELGELQQETESNRRKAEEALSAAARIIAESRETAGGAADEVDIIGGATDRIRQLLDRLENRIAADPPGPMD